MQIKVDEWLVGFLKELAKHNRRSPTQEANLAIYDHLSAYDLSEWLKKAQRGQEKKKKKLAVGIT